MFVTYLCLNNEIATSQGFLNVLIIFDFGRILVKKPIYKKLSEAYLLFYCGFLLNSLFCLYRFF